MARLQLGNAPEMGRPWMSADFVSSAHFSCLAHLS
jgi:hypothetical protein